MDGPPDDFEETWRVLTLPHVDGATLPIDAGGEPAAAGPDLVVVRLLGEGGMGRVQLARQRSLEREVALERPHPGANVMVGEFGEVYLIDWGVAVETGTVARGDSGPVLVGTPAYMAPEMVRGAPLDERTDVYLWLCGLLLGASSIVGAAYPPTALVAFGVAASVVIVVAAVLIPRRRAEP